MASLTLRGPMARMRFVRDGQITRPVHFIASPQNTGTASMALALKQLKVGKHATGPSPRMMERWRSTIIHLNRRIDPTMGPKKFVRLHAADSMYLLEDLTKALAGYDIFDDGPFGQIHIHPYVRKVIAPEAKFIWINRPVDDWIASVRRRELADPKNHPQFREWRHNPERYEGILKRRWRIERRKFLKLAARHPDDCLEVDLETLTKNGIGPVAEFYGLKDPGTPFPQASKPKR